MAVALIGHQGQVPIAYQPSFSTIPSPSTTLATHVAASASSGAVASSYSSPSVVSPLDTTNVSMRRSRKCSIGVFSTILSYLTLSFVCLSPHEGGPSDEEAAWIATSPSWVDRQACRWIGICGAMHLNRAYLIDGTSSKHNQQKQVIDTQAFDKISESFWTSGLERPDEWTEEERHLREIPQYVYDYTPYVHLFSGEQFWPCDVAEHLVHTSPYLNYTPIHRMDNDRTLDNLNEVNSYGRYTYLKSEDNVEERPDWLGGSRNIPTGPDQDESRLNGDQIGSGEKSARKHVSHSKEHYAGGRSSAPAVLIVVPKEDGIVDAFWFYFYSYNLGNKVVNIRFGNHVGDWEHSMVRFRNGTPEVVYLSEHGAGQAYSYQAVEKIGKRPVFYSATGTHAMYSTAGLHPYVLPWGLLHDQTDRGPLWDPNLNHHAYVYNYKSKVLKSSAQTPQAPVNWFYFGGHWGDKHYPLSDPRQYRFAGQYHYVSGPLGPRYKNLGRKKACQRREGICEIKHWLGEDKKTKKYPGTGPGQDKEEEAVSNTKE